MTVTTGRAAEIRVLRGLLIATLVLLGVQGWSGDFFTVFAAPSSAIARPALSPGGFLHELAILPTASIPLWHAFEGLALFALAAVIVAVSWRASHSRGVRFWSVLGLLSILSAGLGGLQFVGSGFGDGGASMQMGGSYIAALSSYFLVLYFTK